MANQEMAFIAAMQVAAHEQPDLFSIKDGDYIFMKNYRLPARLVLAMADELHNLEERRDFQRMRAAKLEEAA